MKILLFIVFWILLIQCKDDASQKQIVIPDNNFFNALINLGIDKNGDGLITKDEALQVSSLELIHQNISDLYGIQSFENLLELDCSSNDLTYLDVSNLRRLSKLYCFGNRITSLDVSQNKLLKFLYCYVNPITKLELSNMDSLKILECHDCELTKLEITNCENLSILFTDNTSPLRPYKNKLTFLDCSGCKSLKILFCSSNQIEDLNISDCTQLETLKCGGNQMETLDVSNNTSITQLEIAGMPTLKKVCVWELPFPPTNIELNLNGSPNVMFTTDCF